MEMRDVGSGLVSIGSTPATACFSGSFSKDASHLAAIAARASHRCPWSIQEIRRIAQRLARKRIQHADVIAWSLWRRAHQAAAQKSHLKQKSQL
jgi:hypothetical protein